MPWFVSFEYPVCHPIVVVDIYDSGFVQSQAA